MGKGMRAAWFVVDLDPILRLATYQLCQVTSGPLNFLISEMGLIMACRAVWHISNCSKYAK